MTEAHQDIWSQWLLHRRFGGDPRQMQAALDYLNPVRDRVLNHANLGEGEVLLDVGCGDGLIAFGALDKVKTSRVIFSDISQDLLDHAQSLAQEMNVWHRCQFLQASADDISALSDAAVDVVTMRSVLIYVTAKQQAFSEFYRVLKPGGRLSIFEPINRFAHPGPAHRFWGYNVRPVMELARKVKGVYERRQPPETCPMLDFDERDLLAMAEQAGFKEVSLELQVEVKPHAEEVSWETWLRTAPNPEAPTPEEAIQEALTQVEAEQFVAHLRPLVEGRQGTTRCAVVYLWAVKEELGLQLLDRSQG
jgi:ubiquinone/menaquinone biosynthesis C-methylase UbiE